MERPLSAPALGVDYSESHSATDPNDFVEATRRENLQAFSEMEERAAGATGGDNRGNKLSIEELVEGRPSLLPTNFRKLNTPLINDHDFINVEKNFMEAIAYRKNATTAGLTNSEVRLLYSEWGRLARMKSDALRCALGTPNRLSEALNSSAVRSGLFGASLRVVNQAVLDLIVDINKERVSMLRLQDSLNISLTMVTDEEEALNDLLDTPSIDLQVPCLDSLSKDQLISILALCSHCLHVLQCLLDELAAVRSGLVSAIEYGQIVGRFLAKRLRRSAQKRIAASKAFNDNISVAL